MYTFPPEQIIPWNTKQEFPLSRQPTHHLVPKILHYLMKTSMQSDGSNALLLLSYVYGAQISPASRPEKWTSLLFGKNIGDCNTEWIVHERVPKLLESMSPSFVGYNYAPTHLHQSQSLLHCQIFIHYTISSTHAIAFLTFARLDILPSSWWFRTCSDKKKISKHSPAEKHPDPFECVLLKKNLDISDFSQIK